LFECKRVSLYKPVGIVSTEPVLHSILIRTSEYCVQFAFHAITVRFTSLFAFQQCYGGQVMIQYVILRWSQPQKSQGLQCSSSTDELNFVNELRFHKIIPQTIWNKKDVGILYMYVICLYVRMEVPLRVIKKKVRPKSVIRGSTWWFAVVT